MPSPPLPLTAAQDLYSGRKPSFDVTSLKPARSYRFRLRAQRVGAGGKRLAKRAAEWSEWHEAIFSCEAAPPLQLLPLALAEGGASAHSLRLLCRGLVGCGAPITCVRLELQTGAVGDEETFYQSFPGVPRGAGSTQLTARGLAPSSTYRLRARAGNSKGEGPWSPAMTCATLEEVSEKLAPPALWSKGHDAVHLVWMAATPPPAAAAGGPRQSQKPLDPTYELQMQHMRPPPLPLFRATPGGGGACSSGGATAPSGEWRTVHVGTSCGHEERQLTPGETYSFRVRAEGGGLSCTWSDALLVTTDAAAPARPDAPQLIAAQRGTIELSWAAPASHGSPLTKHELQATLPPPPDAPAAAAKVISFAAAVSTATGRIAAATTGLPPGRPVSLRARAINALGEGPWGEALSLTTPSEPPGPPAELRVVDRGPAHLTLSWRRGEVRAASLRLPPPQRSSHHLHRISPISAAGARRLAAAQARGAAADRRGGRARRGGRGRAPRRVERRGRRGQVHAAGARRRGRVRDPGARGLRGGRRRMERAPVRVDGGGAARHARRAGGGGEDVDDDAAALGR